MIGFTFYTESAQVDKGPGIVLENVPAACMNEIKGFVCNNWMDSEAYRLKRKVNPFLQGVDEFSGWMFIEFWSRDIEAMEHYVTAIHHIVQRHQPDVEVEKKATSIPLST